MKIELLGPASEVSCNNSGHVNVRVSATTERTINARVYVSSKHERLFDVVPNASMPYFIPAFDRDGGYEKELRFSITPLEAEPGKLYDFELHYLWEDPSDKENPHHHEKKDFQVPVHASESTYFAMGVAKALHEKSENFYLDMINKGRNTHKQQWAVFGGSDLDPARVVLNEESFNWVMSLFELGSRVYRTQVDAVKTNVMNAAADAGAEPQPADEPAASTAGDDSSNAAN